MDTSVSPSLISNRCLRGRPAGRGGKISSIPDPGLAVTSAPKTLARTGEYNLKSNLRNEFTMLSRFQLGDYVRRAAAIRKNVGSDQVSAPLQAVDGRGQTDQHHDGFVLTCNASKCQQG